jgi:hypothetical protein
MDGEQHAPAHLRPDAVVPPEGGGSRWVGWLVFAGVMMILLGAFNLVDGLVSLVSDRAYGRAESSLLLFDYSTWGWVWLVIAVVVLIAGLGVLAGQTWARAVGVAVAGLNAVAQLAFVGAAPVWSILVIALDVVVIYALIVHGAELSQGYSRT